MVRSSAFVIQRADLLVPGIRGPALQPRLPSGEERGAPFPESPGRDAQLPGERPRVFAAQETEHGLDLPFRREPARLVALGAHRALLPGSSEPRGSATESWSGLTGAVEMAEIGNENNLPFGNENHRRRDAAGRTG